MTAADLTGLSVDITAVIAAAVIVITAIYAIWPTRKVIKLGNKS